MINICNSWSKKWRTTANVSKSAIMIINGDENNDDIVFKWGQYVIPKQNKYTYIGL